MRMSIGFETNSTLFGPKTLVKRLFTSLACIEPFGELLTSFCAKIEYDNREIAATVKIESFEIFLMFIRSNALRSAILLISKI